MLRIGSVPCVAGVVDLGLGSGGRAGVGLAWARRWRGSSASGKLWGLGSHARYRAMQLGQNHIYSDRGW